NANPPRPISVTRACRRHVTRRGESDEATAMRRAAMREGPPRRGELRVRWCDGMGPGLYSWGGSFVGLLALAIAALLRAVASTPLWLGIAIGLLSALVGFPALVAGACFLDAAWRKWRKPKRRASGTTSEN